MIQTNIPHQVKGINGNGFLSNVISVAAGGNHVLALLSDGRVVAFGRNSVGQLGIGQQPNQNVPNYVKGFGSNGFLENIVAIDAGNSHSIALSADGTVWSWGRNNMGQLGAGDNSDKFTPVKVIGLSNIATVKAGYQHSLALGADGKVWAWGENLFCELGIGTTNQGTNFPVKVTGLSDVIAIDTKHVSSLALQSDGSVWGWGASEGIGAWFPAEKAPDKTAIPLQIKASALFSGPLTNIIDIFAGSHHGLALAADGNVWVWGNNGEGQLAISGADNKTLAVVATNLNNIKINGIVTLAAGDYHNLALDGAGNLYGWGKNTQGQIGKFNNYVPNNPTNIYQYLNEIKALAAGWAHGLALKATGRLCSWGGNFSGQLGNNVFGVNAKSNIPVKVLTKAGNLTADLLWVKAIAAGASHSLALKADGKVLTWGANGYGQLAGSTESPRPYAKPALISQVSAIAAGANFNLALKTDGRVWAWGNNLNGQLGNKASGIVSNAIPSAVIENNGFLSFSKVSAIAAGSSHALALRSDGTVWAWGYNGAGEIGNNGALGTTYTTPVQVKGPNGNGFLSNIITIAAGDCHSLALRADGTVWAWGNNMNGQLGNGLNGLNTGSPVPVQVLQTGGVPLTNIVAITSRYYHNLALRADGKVMGWGNNLNGQLANGNKIDQNLAVAVNISNVTSIAVGESFSGVRSASWTVKTVGYNSLGQLGDGSAYGTVNIQYGNDLVIP